jgi:hypothetical protein
MAGKPRYYYSLHIHGEPQGTKEKAVMELIQHSKGERPVIARSFDGLLDGTKGAWHALDYGEGSKAIRLVDLTPSDPKDANVVVVAHDAGGVSPQGIQYAVPVFEKNNRIVAMRDKTKTLQLAMRQMAKDPRLTRKDVAKFRRTLKAVMAREWA